MPYNLNYKQIQTFLQIVETHNLTEAANILYLTQPAVTKQIKSLELGASGLIIDFVYPYTKSNRLSSAA
ncbi:MAG: LysR family transcriptional regulator [Francisellaceae bacterium]